MEGEVWVRVRYGGDGWGQRDNSCDEGELHLLN